MRRVTIATAQYPIDAFKRLEDYEAKIANWVTEATARGAELLVFPHYGAMELTALAGEDAADLKQSILALDRMMPEIGSLHQSLARRHGVHILAASAPLLGGDGLFRNVVFLFAPNGKIGRQEKIVMTRSERETWGISSGGPISVFKTSIGTIGICLCYDIEFPLIARAQAEAGAEIILAPSASSTLQGYWRVRIGAQARALENQCFVVQALTVGAASWSSGTERHQGAAGIYAPPDGDFPDNGAIVVGAMNEPGWVTGTVDLDQTADLRERGAVLNFQHWPEQGVVTAPMAEMFDLT
jgi:predicted amidohydrolase